MLPEEDLEVLHDLADPGVDRQLEADRASVGVYPQEALLDGVVHAVVDVAGRRSRGLRTRLRCTSDLSARITAAETGETAVPSVSSWFAIAAMIGIRSAPSRGRAAPGTRAPRRSGRARRARARCPRRAGSRRRTRARASRSVNPSRCSTWYAILPTRFAWRNPCSVYPIASITRSADAM